MSRERDLYQADRVDAAPFGAIITVTSDPLDADALERAGAPIATASITGDWPDLMPLYGKPVLVVEPRSRARQAREVGADLARRARCKVSYALPDVPHLADWMAAGDRQWETLEWVTGDQVARMLSDGPEASLTPAEQFRASLLTDAQIRALPPPEPLVDGLLELNSLAMLYGDGGVGKTHLVIDWARRAPRGMSWQGRACTAGPVIYVIAEGAEGAGARIDAWDAFHEPSPADHALLWRPEAIHILDPVWVAAMVNAVADLKPVLVVLDTYARCLVGGDENSTRDTATAVDHLDQIRRAAGSCVLIVHHPGKNADLGARGNTALRNAMDTELCLTGDENHMVLRNTKQKNGAKAAPIHLALTPFADSVVVTAHKQATPDIISSPSCRDEVLSYFSAIPGVELNQRRTLEMLRAHWAAQGTDGFSDAAIFDALNQLTLEARLTFRRGARSSKNYSLR